jgi:hypothetical protein
MHNAQNECPHASTLGVRSGPAADLRSTSNSLLHSVQLGVTMETAASTNAKEDLSVALDAATCVG